MKGWILQRNYIGKKISYETLKIIDLAKKSNITLTLHDPFEFEIIINNTNEKNILLNNIKVELPDFILPRMGASTHYFALSLIKQFETLGIPCINSSRSIEIVKDKLQQLQVLSGAKIPIPKTIFAKLPLNIKLINSEFKFPLIVKPLNGTQGNGVFLCENKNMLEDLMKVIQQANRFSNFIIQEFISDSKGRDIRVFVIGNKIIGSIERNSSDESFKANFSRGGTTKKIEIPDYLKKQTLEITKLFNLDIAGIDYLFDGNSYRICEVNSSPGFKGFEQVNEINVAQEILNFIKSKIINK